MPVARLAACGAKLSAGAEAGKEIRIEFSGGNFPLVFENGYFQRTGSERQYSACDKLAFIDFAQHNIVLSGGQRRLCT
jgi:hypothetical protein